MARYMPIFFGLTYLTEMNGVIVDKSFFKLSKRDDYVQE